MTKNTIYLDNSATTPISDKALSKYNDIAKSCYGNPSSLHEAGVLAEREIEAARKCLLSSVGAKDATAVFTASGSEANNLAIFGRAFAKDRFRRMGKIITTVGEHASVNAPLDKLSSLGFEIVYVPTKNGELDLDFLSFSLDERTILVSMMMVNNETGALYDMASVGRLIKARARDALFHIDATQSYLKIPFTKNSACADMITVSSHKIHGPKGVGALIIGRDVIKSSGICPMILGGGQELGLRSGTENVPAIAAFAAAVEEGVGSVRNFYAHTNELREYLIAGLSSAALSEISPTLPNSHAPHIINITLPNIKSETMLHYLSNEGIFVSSGSACSSHGALHGTSALVAYGRSEAEADCSIRISFSKNNTKSDVDALLLALERGVSKLARIK